MAKNRQESEDGKNGKECFGGFLRQGEWKRKSVKKDDRSGMRWWGDGGREAGVQIDE